MLNFMHLESLIAVIETGSFSGAGKKLGYTTSAVSQQIAALERNLGVQLFERGPRNLWPTVTAQHVSEAAGGVLTHIAELEARVRAAALSDRGQLRIASFPSIGSRVLPRALAELIRSFPDADFPVSEKEHRDSIVEAVSSMRADLGLVFAYSALPISWPENLTVIPLLEEEIVVIADAHRQPGLPALCELSSLSDEVWAAHHPGSPGRANLDHWCSALDFTPNVMFETDNHAAIRGLVRENLALGMIPALALGVDRDITMHRLVDASPRRRVYLIHRESDQNPLLHEAQRTLAASADHFVHWTREGFETYEVEQPLAALL